MYMYLRSGNVSLHLISLDFVELLAGIHMCIHNQWVSMRRITSVIRWTDNGFRHIPYRGSSGKKCFTSVLMHFKSVFICSLDTVLCVRFSPLTVICRQMFRMQQTWLRPASPNMWFPPVERLISVVYEKLAFELGLDWIHSTEYSRW